MRKVTLIFGLLSGAIISVLMLTMIVFWENGYDIMETGELIGYASMVIALSMVFFGIKSYRDNNLKGAITFFKGLQLGLLIALVASVIYALSWEGYLLARPNVRETFMQDYTEHCLNQMRADGASDTEIQEKSTQLASMSELYKNPILRFGFTLMEILPVGIVITLISAAILRRKEVLPSQPIGVRSEVG